MRPALAGPLLLAMLAVGPVDPVDKKPRPRFTVGKETTYVTSPIDKDGLINYEAALNKRLGQGVTPEDNANVLLWQAMGPRVYERVMPTEFFELMGMKRPPDEGDYFKDFVQYARAIQKERAFEFAQELEEQLERACQRAWQKKTYPHLAGWLKANEKPLNLVVRATRRPKYFYPHVSNRMNIKAAGLFHALLPGIARCREMGHALSARAMLRVAEGRCDEAWHDLLACHRLGRLVARGGILLEELVGFGIDQPANVGDLAFLDAAKLTSQQLKSCLNDLRQLAPMPQVADQVDLAERFVYLDVIMMINRHGIDYLRHSGIGAVPGLTQAIVENVDWNPALRTSNHLFDRLTAAMRVMDRRERNKHLKQWDWDRREVRAALLRAKGKDAKAWSELLGDTLADFLIPALHKVQDSADRMEQVERNLHVAFALAAYRADQGKYPKELAALAQAYLAAVPNDLFSGKALVYRPDGAGYLLYSVGVNGRDEQGRSADDEPPGDDLAVRMPLPKAQQRQNNQ